AAGPLRAFDGAVLWLCVWHVDGLAEGDKVPIGQAMVPLETLGVGLAEVDGYFHISPPSAGCRPHAGDALRGQIRARVRPCASGLSAEAPGQLRWSMSESSTSAMSCVYDGRVALQQTSTCTHCEDAEAGAAERAATSYAGDLGLAGEAGTPADAAARPRPSGPETEPALGSDAEPGCMEAVLESHKRSMSELDDLHKRLLATLAGDGDEAQPAPACPEQQGPGAGRGAPASDGVLAAEGGPRVPAPQEVDLLMLELPTCLADQGADTASVPRSGVCEDLMLLSFDVPCSGEARQAPTERGGDAGGAGAGPPPSRRSGAGPLPWASPWAGAAGPVLGLAEPDEDAPSPRALVQQGGAQRRADPPPPRTGAGPLPPGCCFAEALPTTPRSSLAPQSVQGASVSGMGGALQPASGSAERIADSPSPPVTPSPAPPRPALRTPPAVAARLPPRASARPGPAAVALLSDTACQTEEHLEYTSSLIGSAAGHSGPAPGRDAGESSGPRLRRTSAPQSPAGSAIAPMLRRADAAELFATPRTDVGSDRTSVATTSVPVELPRFKAKWTSRLDAETQRIARIMRGGRAHHESDGTLSSTSE
ncbi:unnamed protein product, partial [Prorocentrum cordatum]